MRLTRENNAAEACPAQQCHPAGVGDQQGLLPCAPLAATKEKGPERGVCPCIAGSGASLFVPSDQHIGSSRESCFPEL